MNFEIETTKMIVCLNYSRSFDNSFIRLIVNWQKLWEKPELANSNILAGETALDFISQLQIRRKFDFRYVVCNCMCVPFHPLAIAPKSHSYVQKNIILLALYIHKYIVERWRRRRRAAFKMLSFLCSHSNPTFISGTDYLSICT